MFESNLENPRVRHKINKYLNYWIIKGEPFIINDDSFNLEKIAEKSKELSLHLQVAIICGLKNLSLWHDCGKTSVSFVENTIPTIRLLGHEHFLVDKLGIGTFF